MTRNLKALGLAFVAMLAIGAIGAQGASAVVEHSFRSGDNSTVLTGQSESYSHAEGKSRHVFTATPGLTVSCDATFEGTNEDIERDTVTVHPKYSSCTSSLGGSPTVHTNGCNYIFDSDTTQATGHSTSSEHATVSLECEAGHLIEITATGCRFAFAPTHDSVAVNQSLHGVRYTQLSSHSEAGGVSKHALTVTATVRTLHYTATTGSFCGLAGHHATTYTNGSYDGVASVTGYKDTSVKSGSTTEGRTWNHTAQDQVDITISTPT